MACANRRRGRTLFWRIAAVQDFMVDLFAREIALVGRSLQVVGAACGSLAANLHNHHDQTEPADPPIHDRRILANEILSD
jgi:hypothetical protein